MFLPDAVCHILANTRTIALVGASDKPSRESQRIGHYLIGQGYDVYPVNPNHARVYGRACAATLEELSITPDLVLCFRRCEDMPPIARSAIHLGAPALWMQTGIVNEEVADLAMASGMLVVMDRCIAVDHAAWQAAMIH
ncbi:MAG TPA: CoA-binding protein [Burkholderiaceae bacterium]|nr:CoA-binding protein [Burkholderiaceae bacterium]